MSDLTPTIPEPDEQFIDVLERRLRLGIERRSKFDPDNRTFTGIHRKGRTMFGSASLIVLSMMLGATGTYAVVHQDPAPLREYHLQKASILLERAQLRLERRQADLTTILPRVEKGYINPIVEPRIRQKVAEAKGELRHRELDLKETRITGRAPVNDLSGPLVEDEDFVLKRLETRNEAIDLELKLRMAEHDRAETLVQKGYGSERELILARAGLEQAKQTLASLQERIRLRRSFINGELAAAEVDLRALQRDTEGELLVAEARISVAQNKLQQITALHEGGRTTRYELREAQAEMHDAESDLSLAEVQLKMIRQRLEAIKQKD